jgi:Gram-negative porin
MDMFGGLTKTFSRIAITAALGLVIGGFAFKATPARAADLGGDCCADLEERVAELEATTVRKGNKKVSVTLSGWVVKSFNWWDDGDIDSAIVGDKGYDLGSRFALTGTATIAPGWTAGYNLTVLTGGDIFSAEGTSCVNCDQFTESGATFGFIQTLYSFIYIKSDKWGALNWGLLSPASDNPAVLADISGTVIESNAVWFEGASFFLRPKGSKIGGFGGLSGLNWADFLQCQGLGAGIGADCFGAAQPAVRYDSPTWGGFRFETSWGKNELTQGCRGDCEVGVPTPDANFWDIAVFYTADWNSIKLSAAAAYTWQESAKNSGGFLEGFCNNPNSDGFQNCHGDRDGSSESNLFQIGASVLHKPSGLGIYGLWQTEDTGGDRHFFLGGPFISDDVNLFRVAVPDSDVWYVKPFWRKTWSPIGATTLFGEFGQYNDQFNPSFGSVCGAFNGLGGTNIHATCGGGDDSNGFNADGVFATGSTMERWGLGVVQEIDSAAMHLFARWQHQDADVDFTAVRFDFDGVNGTQTREHVNQSFDDWDLFQVGGIIFF